MGYEQMELDVTLSGERELKDNVSLAVEFACRQIAAQNQKVVESNHEGYGIAAEGKVALDSAMKKVSDAHLAVDRRALGVADQPTRAALVGADQDVTVHRLGQLHKNVILAVVDANRSANNSANNSANAGADANGSNSGCDRSTKLNTRCHTCNTSNATNGNTIAAN